MSKFDCYFGGSLNPKNFFDVLKYKYAFKKENPNYFDPEGITIFTGGQGSGKTLSAVNLLKMMLNDYPKAVFVTNTRIKNISNKTILCESAEDMIDRLISIDNGNEGVVYFIDEIQTLLNSLQSKDIPLSVIAELTQQRRQRKIIIGSSQVFERMAKPLREQVKNVVVCSCKFGCVQVNNLIDVDSCIFGENEAVVDYNTVKTFIWFHNLSLYNSYETLGKIKSFVREKKKNNFYTGGSF